jgi:RND family efflux transporter MFP subunit
LELEQRETVNQRKKVQDLENTLRLLPTQRAVQKEQLAVYRSQLESARLDLKRTRISLPFNARIGDVNVEEQQFVQTGNVLLTADSLDVAEVEAQVPIGQFRSMVRAAAPRGLEMSFDADSLNRIVEKLGFEATVRLRAGEDVVEWPASFSRVSNTIDPKTRTVGVIVAVDGAYAQASPGERPPLTKGMFVEIEVRVHPRDDVLVVPRSAVHDGKAFLVSPDNRLEVRDIEKGLSQGSIVVVSNGLEPGEQIVVSDLVPAIEGMLLEPQPDASAQEAVRIEAAAGDAEQ